MIEISPSPTACELDWRPPAGADARRQSGPTTSERRRRRLSWLASALVHGLTGSAIAAELLLALVLVIPPPTASQQVELAGVLERESNESPPALATLPIQIKDDPTARAVADEQIAYLAARTVTPELEQQLLDGSNPAGDAVAATWVQQRVADEIAAAERLDQDDQFRHLQQLTGTLNRVSSTESVNAIASRLQTLLGTSGRAQEPAKEPVAGEFDHDTAQLHDVKRADDGNGGYTYVGILLDAEGRTMETPLSASEGESLFRIMELVKSNPLLERVYRSVVMSLMDKMLKPTAATVPPPPASETEPPPVP